MMTMIIWRLNQLGRPPARVLLTTVTTVLLSLIGPLSTFPQTVRTSDPDGLVPIAIYDAPEPKDTKERELRRARNKRYDKRLPYPLKDDPRVGGMGTIISHWEYGLAALPAEQSDAIVVGEVVEARGHLSNDKTGIYSEFTVRIKSVLKEGGPLPLRAGQTITAQREGGAVRFPSGRVLRHEIDNLNYPRPGGQYVLFLKHLDPGHDFSIITGYQLRDEVVVPLDGREGHRLQFARYENTSAEALLKEVRDEVAKTSGSIMISSSEIAVDQEGNLFFTDVSHVYRLDAKTGVISTVAGNGYRSFGGDGGPAIKAGINSPLDLAVDGAGNLFIADWENRRVRRVDAQTGVITTVAGNGNIFHSGDGGPATEAGIDAFRIAVDGRGRLYIANYHSSKVREVDLQTGIITTAVGNGESKYSGDGGPATEAGLNPVDVAADYQGNIYIADANNYRVRRVDAETGIINTVAGNGVKGMAGDGGMATKANLGYGESIALDEQGNLFIADSHNRWVWRVDAKTGICKVFAAAADQTSKSMEGNVADGITGATRVAVDGAGNLFVVAGFRVQRIDGQTGEVTTVSGKGKKYN